MLVQQESIRLVFFVIRFNRPLGKFANKNQ